MATDARPTTPRAGDSPRAPGVTLDDLYRLSVEQYEAMIRDGILSEDVPVELLEGCLIEKHALDGPRGPIDAVYPLAVAQYEAMVERGLLTEDDPVELQDGLLVRRMTKNPPHELAKGQLLDAILPLLPAGWFVAVEVPITLAGSLLEPDVMLARGRRHDYADRHPSAADAGLVVEIADSSSARDRGAKLRAYAAAGVPAYGVVNLAERRVEAYADPDGPAYRVRVDHGPDSGVPLVLDAAPRGAVAIDPLLA